ncbi:MAG TPA: DMT family transporter [Chthoniobacterales bacterium]
MKNPIQSNSSGSDFRSGLLTFAIVAGSSILFCSKGVFAKLAFAAGADAVTVLALRMAFALPFFLAIAAGASRGAARLDAATWLRLAALGFLGYYFSSLVNFTGLQYVSIGLERIILYTYPSIVLVISAFFLRRRVRPVVWLACAVAWIGICAAFAGELRHPQAADQAVWGAFLIFLSALSYAGFILLSGGTIARVGVMRFTGLAVGFSCLFMLAHYGLTHDPRALGGLPAVVYGYGGILAVFGTVLPALLLSIGLKRAGAANFSIISAIGPVATFFLAWALLGESPNAGQLAGFALTLAGGLGISLLRTEKVSPD